ncbi:MAG TPA: nitroreductase family protein [Candidatus Saccharimonadales bacterium]|nr:nitroreductase family protein [Candidatus Saccharimonadales bacterium]
MTVQPRRERRADPSPVDLAPSVGVATPAAAPRPWSVDRVQRGVRRRLGLATDVIRDQVILPVAARNAFLASVYYAIGSRDFRREHLATLRGRWRYRAQQGELGRHEYLLRRNVHMLEKGLVMRPRRPVFALDYINATVVCYGAVRALAANDPEAVDERQLHWANDVLTTYFSVVGPHKTIDKVRARWDAIEPLAPQSAALIELAAPYQRALDAAPPVRYDDLHRLALRRRSVRWFLPRPVPRELIDQAFEIAALSPSACNRQPFEFRVFDDPESVARVATIPKGTRGFAQGFPAFAVVVGRMSAFFSERDRHLIYIDGALASMSFVLGLESLGLASCLINWSDQPEPERAMAEALGLAPDERPVVCIAFGYPDPDGMVPFSEKRPLDRLRRYETPS